MKGSEEVMEDVEVVYLGLNDVIIIIDYEGCLS